MGQGHTFLNYSEANLYSDCVQHFMKNQDIASEQLVLEFIDEHAPVNMTQPQRDKVLTVAIAAIFTDNNPQIDYSFNAIHA